MIGLLSKKYTIRKSGNSSYEIVVSQDYLGMAGLDVGDKLYWKITKDFNLIYSMKKSRRCVVIRKHNHQRMLTLPVNFMSLNSLKTKDKIYQGIDSYCQLVISARKGF